ncbi:MAG: cobalamin-dependent protein [Candidatus Competibacter sp.]|nr:cobalamin-dependent protein [Candidatus Competibacter sp.]
MNARELSAAIEARRPAIAEAVATRQYAEHPELRERYGPVGWQRTLEDASYNLAFLAQAIALENPALFVDYLGWLKVVLLRRRVRLQDVLDHFAYLQDGLRQSLPAAEAAAVACAYVAEGVRRLPDLPDDLPTLIEGNAPISLLAHRYLQALMRGERHVASRLVLDAVTQGTPVKDIYLGVFQPCQREIGRLWQTNQISVAQEHYCTAATQWVMSQLYPYIFSGEKGAGRLVATCIAAELHEIGVRMVADFFEMEGWDTFYLGANTPTDSVLGALVERRADVLGISATITYHVSEVQRLIQAVRAAPACRDVLVLVGGYPFNLAPDLWRRIGADGWAPDAQTAVERARELLAARRPA